jgi:hypothetical protein
MLFIPLRNFFTEFFAKTINDHFSEYNPWFLDLKRGSAFTYLYNDVGVLKSEYSEFLYKVAWTHHRLLYKYLRMLIATKTGLRQLPERDQQLLVGQVDLGDNVDNGTSIFFPVFQDWVLIPFSIFYRQTGCSSHSSWCSEALRVALESIQSTP